MLDADRGDVGQLQVRLPALHNRVANHCSAGIVRGKCRGSRALKGVGDAFTVMDTQAGVVRHVEQHPDVEADVPVVALEFEFPVGIRIETGWIRSGTAQGGIGVLQVEAAADGDPVGQLEGDAGLQVQHAQVGFQRVVAGEEVIVVFVLQAEGRAEAKA